MDYNDVQARLKNIYSSIDEQYSYGHEALGMAHWEQTDNQISFSFLNPNNKPRVINQINNVISNLANIKDCLKKKLQDRGDDPQAIEYEINDSLYLQLVLDLSNQEKHGYPLTKTSRSQKNPLIKNVNRGLSRSNRLDNIRYEQSDGSVIVNMMIIITADVTDSQDNLLCRLDELVENALKFWENTIKKYNID